MKGGRLASFPVLKCRSGGSPPAPSWRLQTICNLDFGAFVLSIFRLRRPDRTARLNCPSIFNSMCLAEVSALRYSMGGAPINYLHLGLCVHGSVLFPGVGGGSAAKIARLLCDSLV